MKRQVDKYYFDHPEVWEHLSRRRFEREPPFLASLFRRHGPVRRVLDVGCGTGEHLQRLSGMGFDGVGVDLNEHMVAFARDRYPALRFEVADMRDLAYEDEFDAVMCLCTVFCYATANDEIVATLRGFHRALRPGGLVVIDVLNPIVFIESRSFREQVGASYEPFGLRSETTHTIHEARQLIIERRSMYRTSDGALAQSDLTELRLFFPQELAYFLDVNGFEVLGLYGGFDLEKRDLDGMRLIALGRKP